MQIQPITSVIPIAGLTAVLFAVYLARDVLRRDTGTEAMQDVAGTILEGRSRSSGASTSPSSYWPWWARSSSGSSSAWSRRQRWRIPTSSGSSWGS